MKRPPPPPPGKKGTPGVGRRASEDGRRTSTRARSQHDATSRDEVPAAPAPADDFEIDLDDESSSDARSPKPDAPLELAICETHGYLASARTAVAACGHVVALGAGGADGIDQIVTLIRRENVDCVLVALPGPATPFDATPLVGAALALEPRRPILVGVVTGSGVDAVRRAREARVDLVVARPHDAEHLAPVLLAAARLGAAREAEANARGAETVLRSKLEQVSQGEPGGLHPLELFQRATETEIKRARRYAYPLAVAMFAVELAPPPPPSGVRGILRARAGNAIVRTIRDIDIATQLDHERFMVLLPNTTIDGAANLARRVIATVASGDAVAASGRVFPPRVAAAVAGAIPGAQLSFSKLVHDASRALEQARRDGREIGGL